MHAMMGHVEDTFWISEQHTKCCTLDITGQAFLSTLLIMLKDVTIAKEWVDLRHLMRFPYNLKS